MEKIKLDRLSELTAISRKRELTEDEKAILTDACKILVLKGESVALVRGDVGNIKLTYTNDMRIARAMIDNGDIDNA